MSRFVIKVGTATLYQDEKLSHRIDKLVEFLVELNAKHQVILVSSGAVGAGYTKLKLDKNIISNKQALASIGQPLLMREYKMRFEKYNQIVSQVLLTAADFDSRKRTQNAKNMIEVLLSNNVIPIINENDAVSIKELVFGDNDQLSAYVAYYFDADMLVILSDIDGLYDKNPKEHDDAVLLKEVKEIDDTMLQMPHNPNDNFATGGIVTKLKSAQFLMQRGISMFLASGFDLDDVKSFLFDNKHKKGTLFKGD
ncbi:MAG: glutamate 5-kinase [Epsilonproteobacteria bacterium]|nr:glutamate 5-kinase [Campylobacterota bacterium]